MSGRALPKSANCCRWPSAPAALLRVLEETSSGQAEGTELLRRPLRSTHTTQEGRCREPPARAATPLAGKGTLLPAQAPERLGSADHRLSSSSNSVPLLHHTLPSTVPHRDLSKGKVKKHRTANRVPVLKEGGGKWKRPLWSYWLYLSNKQKCKHSERKNN